jgi:dienelactone hydrolase
LVAEPRDGHGGSQQAPVNDARTAPPLDVDAATTADARGTDAAASALDGNVMSHGPMGVRCQADLSMPQRTDYAQAGPHSVATIDVTFEDTSRAIAATDKHASAPSRILVTTIYYPASDATTADGSAALAAGVPFPMLMYSHGFSSNRDEGSRVANRAASYGYVVVAPDFPLTNILANGGAPDIDDAANQPGDVSFLIDQLLAFSRDPTHLLANGIDESRIGALGVSLGGLTTLLVTFHPRFHDARIKVAMPIAPLAAFFAEGFYHTREIPMLLVHGDLDAILNYQQNGRRAFTRSAPNSRLITVAKGTHAAFGFDFGSSTVPLLNAFVAPPNADPSNPDGLGCGAVGETLQMTGPELVTAIGDASDFINYDEAKITPCGGDEYTHPALDPTEQEDIVLRSAVAFFDAHLGSTLAIRQDGCRYLLYEVPKLPSVTLE